MPRSARSPAIFAALVATALACAAALGLHHRRARVSLDASGCARCHPSITQDWSISRHSEAFTNPTFRVSFRNTEHPWCLRCHAASAALGHPLEQGVGCVACHLGADGTLRAVSPSLGATLAHPISADASLTDERLCARCHQFVFPTQSALDASTQTGAPLAFTETPSQDTVGEWRKSQAAARGQTCTSCHDPHIAPGGHDSAWLRETIAASVVYEPERARAVATLTATGAAHAIPTGDPFRRLRLTLCGPERCDPPYAEYTLQRMPRSQGDGWVVAYDTRIGAATDGQTASVSFVLPIEPPLPPGSRWRLFYHYADPMHEHLLPRQEVRSLVAEGQLVPGDREPL